MIGLLVAALAIPYGRCDRQGRCLTRSEQAFLAAFDLMPKVAQLCLSSTGAPLCNLDGEQKRVLTLIRDGAEDERRGRGIQFASERAEPGFFLVDGQVRLAKTGDDVGDPIFVNTDIIDGPSRPDVPAAVASLVHEMGHHHGVGDHVWLDALGAKVKIALARLASRADFAARDLTAYNFTDPRGGDGAEFLAMSGVTTLLWDGAQLVDVTPAVEDARVFCREPTPQLRQLWLNNVFAEGPPSWHVVNTPTDLVAVDTQAVRGRMLYACASSETALPGHWVEIYDLVLDLAFRRDGSAAGRFFEPGLTVRFAPCYPGVSDPDCH